MKKIYILLVFATHVLSASHMEKERKQFHTNCEGIFPAANPSTLTPSYIKNPFQIAPYIPPIVTNNWEIYNDLMNVPYKRAQTITNEFELKPIYRPATNTAQQKKTFEQDVQKPFLRTLEPAKPDKKLIDQLYNKALDITRMFGLDKFTRIVALMNRAMNNNINEDMMGKYSYESWLPSWQNASRENFRAGPVLFFAYLKSYNLRCNTTKEILPNDDDLITKESIKKIGNPLAQKLGLTSSVNVNVIGYRCNDIAIADKYPAFFSVRTYFDKCNYTYAHDLISYVYSDKKTSDNEYLRLSYDNLKYEFYNKTWDLVKNDIDLRYRKLYLYNLINIIEAGKALNPQKQEYDFGYDIIESDPTITGKALALVSIAISIRKTVAMLCHLIKQYNDQRTTKITPTDEQYKAYRNYGILHSSHNNISNFSFPNTFNSTLFNKEIYAFNEFDTLLDMTNSLVHSSDENVQECIDQIYPQRTDL